MNFHSFYIVELANGVYGLKKQEMTRNSNIPPDKQTPLSPPKVSVRNPTLRSSASWFYAPSPATSSAYRYKSSIVRYAGEMMMTSSVRTKKVFQQKESDRRTLPRRTLAVCVRSQPKAGAKGVQQSLAPLLPRTLAGIFLYARKIGLRTLAGLHVHQQSLELQESYQVQCHVCMVSLLLQIIAVTS